MPYRILTRLVGYKPQPIFQPAFSYPLEREKMRPIRRVVFRQSALNTRKGLMTVRINTLKNQVTSLLVALRGVLTPVVRLPSPSWAPMLK